jgi:hypothetical protein
MREKITLTLQSAAKLRQVAALSGKTCGDLVDQALEAWFQQLSVPDSLEEFDADMADSIKVANNLKRKATITGNSVVQDFLRAKKDNS